MISDYLAYKKNSNSWVAPLLNPCFYTVVIYRISNKAFKYRLKIVAKILWIINRIIFSTDIDYRAEIGRNFILVHGIGIVIGCDVIIKDNVKVYQGVTLGGTGQERFWKGKIITQPYIEEGCIIYTNSIVLGPVVIGKNSVLGAASFVTNDVKEKTKIRIEYKLIEKNR